MIKNKKFNKVNIENKVNYSNLRFTLDYELDLKLIKFIYNYFKPNIYFSFDEIINIKDKHKDIFKINNNIKRNEGMKISKGQKLWQRAKDIIPGGNQFLSKKSNYIYLTNGQHILRNQKIVL